MKVYHYIFVLLAVVVVWVVLRNNYQAPLPAIKVGVLHSLTGTMAISEGPVADATLLAIEEINAAGGVLGRQIEPIIVDGKSDSVLFAQEAERLITEEEVAVLFGCWTSASRKSVKPIVEMHDHLLFYPVQYEGMEQSENIVYTGAAPNQQITPAVRWCLDHLGEKIFLVGSDYIFPRAAHEIVRDYAKAVGAEIVGESYLPLGSQDVELILQEIQKCKPDVILNTINGDSNVAFFAGLHRAGLTAEVLPVMSFSLSEIEISRMKAETLAGHYACWNFFQSIDHEDNMRFIRHYQKKHGDDNPVADPMEAAYTSVYLWAQAAEDALSHEPDKVQSLIGYQSFRSPGGFVYVDAETQHLWKTVRIGQIKRDGQFTIVWNSNKPVHPKPYPLTRSQTEWNHFTHSLYEDWGQAWANPGKERPL